LTWKQKVKNFLEGKETLTLQQVTDHTQCDLGKWYYASGKKMYGEIAEMKVFEKQHEKLHSLIKEVIELKKKGNNLLAEEKFKEMNKVSDSIFSSLDKIEKVVSKISNKTLPKISI
jgi:methyl-accepting chemotaxis protein